MITLLKSSLLASLIIAGAAGYAFVLNALPNWVALATAVGFMCLAIWFFSYAVMKSAESKK